METTMPRATATPTSGEGGDGGGVSYAAVGTPKDAESLQLRDGLDAHAISTTALVTTASTTTPPADDAAIASGSATAATGADAASAPVTLRDLYRYASACDRVLLGVGLAVVALNGALFPFMAILFGEAVGSFQPVDMARIERVAAAFAAVAVALFVTDYIAHVCLETTAQKQMHALRIHVFRHVLYKEVAWFERGAPDATSIAELNATTARIKDGMGVKLGEVLRCATQFATGYAIGFSRHWQVSIVMAAVTPFMAISLSWVIKTLRTRAVLSQQVYAQAGAIADETLRAIRTVKAFNGEARAVDNYVAKAKRAEAENIKLVRVLSVVLGIFFGMIWVTYGVGLWFGASVVANGGEADPRTIFSAFYGILIGTISLAQISPNLAAVVSAKVIATPLFKILNEPSRINAEAESPGVVPPTCKGQIEIVNVEFAYPTRPDTFVLRDYNLTIQAGETVAFVGPSGGGKSTLVGLLLRYYDPDAGQIYLDGHLIQDLQLQWLRRQIGIVSQEPVLFAGTIFDNIAAALPEFGEEGDPVGRPERLERRKERIETAAILAHAHEFIMALPNGYDTFVGEKGVALSGGQKQRIAIARALVRDPRILILDEATSALDTESEAQIQNALDSIIAQTSCTTLIVAHRLSTIKRAERICVVVDGQIVETGTHEQLLQNEDGKFHELVMKSRFPLSMIQRNASLMWCDSLTDGLSSERDSSVPILAARSRFDTDSIMDSKRSEFFTTKVPYEEDGSSASHGKVNADTLSVKDHESQPESAEMSTLSVVRRLLHLNNKENHLFAIGMLAAALNGASFPVSAILLSAIVSTMVNKYAVFRASQNQFELDLLYNDVWRLSLAYLVGAMILVFITFAQSYALRYKAEILVTRLRDLYFRAMCHHDVAFFDDPKNGSGALASDLAMKPTQAVILAGDTPGRIVQAVTTFVGALLVSFLMGSWMLSLIMCVLFPLLILSDFVRTNTLKGGGSKTNRNDEADAARANILAAEAVTHIRTVASFGMEKRLIDEYRQLSLLPMQENARVAHSNGMALGFSSFITLAVYAVVFWFGAKLVQDGKITFTELIRSLMAIMISATGIGQATSHLTELDEAKAAARSIFHMQDGSEAYEVAAVPTKERPAALGAIEFQNVMFGYPSRPDTTVMRAFNLRIEPGQLVALCGPSGGGKSTVIALLERFYEPLRGSITLDGARLDSLDRRWLRSQLGLIAQEPVLFAGSIHDNIAYGATDPSSVTRALVQQAAEVAHAHAFISVFPDGYDTDVGANGEQLSGGQKQRIAIARAVLKDPSILLLDEATSALDADSEQLVQDALEHVIKLKKRTTIVIAHRMRTIRHADKICVVASGEVVEQGTHSELLRVTGGLYAKLVENAHDDRFASAD